MLDSGVRLRSCHVLLQSGLRHPLNLPAYYFTIQNPALTVMKTVMKTVFKTMMQGLLVVEQI